jgi:hypothetical protein
MAYGVTLLHLKADKMKWGAILTFKTNKKMGNTHSGKPWKTLEIPGFPGITGKFSSLNRH